MTFHLLRSARPRLHAAFHPCTLTGSMQSVSIVAKPAASLLTVEDHKPQFSFTPPTRLMPSKPLYWILLITRLSFFLSVVGVLPQAPMSTLLSPNLICISIFSVHSQRCPPDQLSPSPKCHFPNIHLQTPPWGAPIPLRPPCHSPLHLPPLPLENGTGIGTETRKRRNTKEGLDQGHVPDPKPSTRSQAHTAATKGPGMRISTPPPPPSF